MSAKGHGRRRSAARDKGQEEREISTSAHKNNPVIECALQPTLQDAVNIIVRSYVPDTEMPYLTRAEEIQPRICGGWVATLPSLVLVDGRYDGPLPAAIRTLALSIASKTSRRMVASTTLWQSYGSTLGLLRRSLRRGGEGICDCAHLAVLMCLTLTEVRKTIHRLPLVFGWCVASYVTDGACAIYLASTGDGHKQLDDACRWHHQHVSTTRPRLLCRRYASQAFSWISTFAGAYIYFHA